VTRARRWRNCSLDLQVTADDLPAAFAGFPPAWAAVLPDWGPREAEAVVAAVRAASGDRPIGPPDPFRALRLVAPQAVRVVLFGQDPYPSAGHADGLAFSAARGRPRSLQRVFEVLSADRPGFVAPPDSRLDGWARQGVLLLNTALSVEIGRAGSHLEVGWQALTSKIASYLSQRQDPPAVLLWGGKAQAFWDGAVSAAPGVRVLKTRHPSYDFQRQFMSEGSHFLATAAQVDWWAL
jgi:uracil-DNA glycosylase